MRQPKSVDRLSNFRAQPSLKSNRLIIYLVTYPHSYETHEHAQLTQTHTSYSLGLTQKSEIIKPEASQHFIYYIKSNIEIVFCDIFQT